VGISTHDRARKAAKAIETTNMMATNDFPRISAGIADLNAKTSTILAKHEKNLEILQSIHTGIQILVDRKIQL
jgi:hypothetical protein